MAPFVDKINKWGTVCKDIADLDRSRVPDRHKSQTRSQLRRQHEAVPKQRRWIRLDALYASDGRPLDSVAEVGEAYRIPIFNSGLGSDSDDKSLLSYVELLGNHVRWSWEPGLTRAVAARAHHSSPGWFGPIVRVLFTRRSTSQHRRCSTVRMCPRPRTSLPRSLFRKRRFRPNRSSPRRQLGQSRSSSPGRR